MNRISLDGSDWQLKGYLGEDWLWRDAHKPGTRDVLGWMPATVPGAVQNDLLLAGEIPNPYFERNSLLIEWVPSRTWLYKKSFQVGPALAGRRLTLVFEGVDFEAQFFLNGEQLGEHRGLYSRLQFDVTDRVRFDQDNLLCVVLAPAPIVEPQVGRTSRVKVHKPRMNYGWDFCPRLVHTGIWDDVHLDISGLTRIQDIWARPRLADDFSSADIDLTVELDSQAPREVKLEVAVLRDGRPVRKVGQFKSLTPGQSTLAFSLPISQPELWYPNGAGPQPLYDADIHVSSGDEEQDSRSVTFGIRRVELTQNESPDPTARPYTFVVNGRKVYIKGWNWVPLDALYGAERPEKLLHLLTLARDAHVNLLRVWGGGLIEKEVFYDLCDRFGIMVWQEFSQSSSGIESTPSADPGFVELMTQEAESIIPRKRNHPSLVLWCGGNELQAGPEQPLDDSAPVLAALHAAVSRLHPDALWLPTSPSGRVFGNDLQTIERDPTALHDVHGPWEYQGLTEQYALYNRGTSLFHSEFGAEGMANQRTLDALIAPEHQVPFSRSNPVYRHLGAWWVNEKMLREVLGQIDDVEVLRRASQFLQAEGLRYAVESNARRMWQNSGSIPWQFDESYPNGACTCAVDYYGEPKPAYYAVARAYESVHVSARYDRLAWGGEAQFEAEAWVTNTGLTDLTRGKLIARIIGASGREYDRIESAAACESNRARAIARVIQPLAPLEELFFLDLVLYGAEDTVLSQNRYVYSHTGNLAPLLEARPTDVAVVVLDKQEEKWNLAIKNGGAFSALFIWIEDARPVGSRGYVQFDDNHICLFPGEERRIRVAWSGAPAEERRLTLRGWNTASVVIR